MDRRKFIQVASGTALGLTIPLAFVQQAGANKIIVPSKEGLYADLYVTHVKLLKKGEINYISSPFKSTLQTNVWQAQLETLTTHPADPNDHNSIQTQKFKKETVLIYQYQQYLGMLRPPMADFYDPETDPFVQYEYQFASMPENVQFFSALSCFDSLKKQAIWVSPDGLNPLS